MRESFADKLRENGIEAEATPRVVRGVVKKSEAQVLRHIEAEEAKRKPRKSTVKESQKSEALAELKSGLRDDPLKPWEKAIKKNQREAKEAWLDVADELDKQNSPEDKILASRIKRYVENFPKPETVNDKLKKEIKSELSRDDLER